MEFSLGKQTRNDMLLGRLHPQAMNGLEKSMLCWPHFILTFNVILTFISQTCSVLNIQYS